MEKIKVSVSQIAPGMKLAEAITNANGVTLMPAGIRLTPMFIARIRKWNIESLDVLVERKHRSTNTNSPAAPSSSTQPPSQALTAEQEEFARQTVQEISQPFINVKSNTVMMQLRAAVIRRLIMLGPKDIINTLRHVSVRKDN